MQVGLQLRRTFSREYEKPVSNNTVRRPNQLHRRADRRGFRVTKSPDGIRVGTRSSGFGTRLPPANLPSPERRAPSPTRAPPAFCLPKSAVSSRSEVAEPVLVPIHSGRQGSP